jgi:regulator of replication initiation timing
VAGETLREALESQATLREQVGGDVFPSLARLKEENEALKSENEELRGAVAELTEAVELLAENQGKLAGNNGPTLRLVEDKVIRE